MRPKYWIAKITGAVGVCVAVSLFVPAVEAEPSGPTQGSANACRIQIAKTESTQIRSRLSAILGGDKGAACPFKDGDEATVYLACSSADTKLISGKMTRLSRQQAIKEVMICSPTYSLITPGYSSNKPLDTLLYYGPHPEPDQISEKEMREWVKSNGKLAQEVRALGLPLTYYNFSNSVICMSAPAGASPSPAQALAEAASKFLPTSAKMMTSHENCPNLVSSHFHLNLPERVSASSK